MMALRRENVVRRLLGMALLLAAGGADAASVGRATAITQVFGDGQKLIAVTLDYGRPIDGRRLAATDFSVEGRTVVGAFASRSPDPSGRAARGRYVIVALSPDDAGAGLRVMSKDRMGGGPPPSRAQAASMGPPPSLPAPTFKPAIATIVQRGPLVAVDGTRFPASAAPIATSRVENLIVDRFRQLTFRDPRTGDVLAYNLFVPKGYDGSKAYPLVLFMHDLGTSSTATTTTLRQGLGAVAWASAADQAKHPSFVLAPQYPAEVVNDRSQATSLLDTTVDLIESLDRQYRVDRGRLYATGQSGGAMMTIAMNIKYPDLFAASFIVAGQWDPAKVAPLARDKLWIMVSQGDLKAYPGENAITAVLEQAGAKVSRAVWDGRSTPAQFDADVARMEAEGSPINYVALRKGTVVPPGQADDGGSNHINTWRIAYTIGGIRDWLFRQHK